MIYAYIGKNKKLCLRPADPEGEKELREFLQQLKQIGLEAIDVETEMDEGVYEHYKRHRQPGQHGGEYSGKHDFGFQPKSYFPMPPDFDPQSHRFYPPFILPFWFGDDTGGGYEGRRGRDGRGGRGGRGGRRMDTESRRGRGGRGGGGGSRSERYGYEFEDEDYDGIPD